MPASRYGSGPATLPEAYPRVESIFKVLWADHGDMVSTHAVGRSWTHGVHAICWWALATSSRPQKIGAQMIWRLWPICCVLVTVYMARGMYMVKTVHG
eukprot:scaffold83186_cov18-Tisochrysis_lutea.AAC.1